MREQLKSWFPFHGRIGRRQYWISTMLYLFGWLMGTALLVALAALNYNPPDDTITSRTIGGFVLLGIAMIIFVFVIVLGITSTGVRRLHHRGKTGYWLLLYYLSMMSKNAVLDTIGLIFSLGQLSISASCAVKPAAMPSAQILVERSDPAVGKLSENSLHGLAPMKMSAPVAVHAIDFVWGDSVELARHATQPPRSETTRAACNREAWRVAMTLRLVPVALLLGTSSALAFDTSKLIQFGSLPRLVDFLLQSG
jgi:uncharacterized membrane protein YhaH (DUF805 family)